MKHSITFGDKHTWNDWRLIPSPRPVINPPAVRTNYVDIPWGDGQIDLTENLTGEPTFGNRTGTFEFIVDNDHMPWVEAYATIANYLHGKEMRMILDDDPGHYYEGRFFVMEWLSNPNFSTITIAYSVGPNKKPTGG